MNEHLSRWTVILCVTLMSCLGYTTYAHTTPDPEPDYVIYPDSASVTYHTIEIDGKPLTYEATAGTITLARLSGQQ